MLLGVRPRGGDSVTAVHGELAGEPLHFEEIAGWFRAIGGVPLDAGDTVAARVVIDHANGASDTLVAPLPVAPRKGRRELLHAAPRFVEPPDSLSSQIQAEGDLVRDLRRRAHDTPRLWSEGFLRPRRGRITDRFGVARVFNEIVRSRHLGVDFAGASGAPVRAPNRGVVAFVGDLYYSGTTLFLDHGAGLVTGYFHLSRALVAPGDTVARGQLIARVGSSGRATGPHLHWLAAYGEVTVDPLSLLTLDLAAPFATPAP